MDTHLPALADRLKQIGGLRGTAQFFDGFDLEYDQWYQASGMRFESASLDMGRTFFSRHRVHILKLAVIYEASMSGTLRVSPKAWERAILKAAELEKTLLEQFRTGMTGAGHLRERMEGLVKEAGERGIPKTVLTERFKNLDPKTRKQCFETLLESGIIRMKTLDSTGGRPMTLVIHREFPEN